MKNVTVKVSLYCAAALALSAIPGFAQQTGRLAVKVPFEFTAGTSTLPAGDYEFQEEDNGVVYISCSQERKGILIMTNPDSVSSAGAQPSLKFDKSGDQYVLTLIDLTGGPARRVLHTEHDQPTSLSAKIGVTNASSKGLKKQ